MRVLGHAAGDPDELIFVALMQDEATYRQLADNPAQDAWYRRFAELVEGDVRWEDIADARLDSDPA